MAGWTRAVALAGAAVFCALPAMAGNAPWEEYDKLITKAGAVTAHGPTLFGDQVSLQNGALSFRATDVSVPGNNALPVEITRTFQTETRPGIQFSGPPRDYKVQDAPFADWDLELPSISGVFPVSTGWINSAAGKAAQRCTVANTAEIRSPTVISGGVSFQGEEVWHGTRITLPGRGSQALLLRAAGLPQPTAGGAYWITSDWTSVACLTTIQNGTGQGFLATTADGTRYWFDWMARADETRLSKIQDAGAWGRIYVHLERGRYALYATKAQDRFGNTVEYTYTNAANAPVRLERIESNDGRVITLAYSGNFVSSATAHGRTWNYAYTGSRLTSVTLPDASAWSIDLDGFKQLELKYYEYEPSVQWRACGDPGEIMDRTYTGTITHPSGAVGEFVVGPRRFVRNGMPGGNCSHGHPSELNDDAETYPSAWDAYSLLQKQLSGPALTPVTWSYVYQGGNTTQVYGPGKYEKHTFGNSFRTDEGKLLSVEVGSSATNILSTTNHDYSLALTGTPYFAPLGDSGQWRSDTFTEEYPRPSVARVITQDGTDFIWVVAEDCNGGYCLDPYARPTKVLKTSMAAGTTDLVPPSGTPTLAVPATSLTGSYSVSWTAVGYATNYQLQERLGSGAWATIHNAVGTSKALSGKANGIWGYQVRACNAQGCAAWSAIDTIEVMVPPSTAPVVTAPASSSTGSYTVTWTTVARATRYELDERKDSGAWVNIYNAGGTGHARLLGSGTYQYRARACNNGGCSAYSTVVTTIVTAATPPPAAPTGLSVPTTAEKSAPFTVSWYSVSGATSYELERNRDGTGWSTPYTGTATSTSQTLSLDGVYDYRVRACSANGCGAYSSTQTVVVGGNNLLPPDPGSE
jgi:YD repeat-containing protein